MFHAVWPVLLTALKFDKLENILMFIVWQNNLLPAYVI